MPILRLLQLQKRKFDIKAFESLGLLSLKIQETCVG